MLLKIGRNMKRMIKEINYWKIIGISFILTIILYVITGLLLTVSDPNLSSGLWTAVWGMAIIAMSTYSFRKTGSKKEILYFAIVFLTISTLGIPGITILISMIHFVMTLMRVEKMKLGEKNDHIRPI